MTLTHVARGQSAPSVQWNELVDLINAAPGAIPVGNWLQVFNVRKYGAVGTGVADDSAAILATLAAAVGGGIVYFPKGTYLIAANVTLPTQNDVVLAAQAVVKVDNTYTVTFNGPVHMPTPDPSIFIYVGTGKVVFGTGVVDALRPEWWGAVADDATDNTTAMNRCLAAIPTAGGKVQLSMGTYRHSAALVLTKGHVEIVGVIEPTWASGAGTVLRPTAGCDQISITGASYAGGALVAISIRKISFYNPGRGVAAVRGINAKYVNTLVIEECSFDEQTFESILCDGVLEPVVKYCRFSATGGPAHPTISLTSSVAGEKITAPRIEHNVFEVPYFWGIYSSQPGVGNADGAEIHHNWFEGTNNGPSDGFIYGDYADGTIHDNFILDMHVPDIDNYGIWGTGPNATYHDNYIGGCGTGFKQSVNGGALVRGNHILYAKNWGILLSQGGDTVSDNWLYEAGTGAGLGGISVESTQNIVHHNHLYRSADLGIRVKAGALYVRVYANDIDDNGGGLTVTAISEEATANYNDFAENYLNPKGGGTAMTLSGSHSHAWKNRGYNPRGWVGDTAAGGSPYTYTNADFVDEDVYVIGGTVTLITKGGKELPVSGPIPLAPEETIVVTHAGAPTIRRFGR